MRQKKSPEEIYLERHRKCGIKVGDKVKVMRKCESYERGWNASWEHTMDDSVCILGTVTLDNDNCGFSLSFKDKPEFSGYSYPYFVLQKVENKEEKVTVRMCKTKAEARALANFLWNEKQRHLNDIGIIDEDLRELKVKWGVWPREVKAFVRP